MCYSDGGHLQFNDAEFTYVLKLHIQNSQPCHFYQLCIGLMLEFNGRRPTRAAPFKSKQQVQVSRLIVHGPSSMIVAQAVCVSSLTDRTKTISEILI